MLILTLRTDKPEAELGLLDDEKKVAYETWQAHYDLSKTIHSKIEELLRQVGKSWPDVQGIVAFQGPGSFTGLRIGLTVANALAYGLNIPIVGSQGDDWKEKGISRLKSSETDQNVLPLYGAPVHITAPKK